MYCDKVYFMRQGADKIKDHIMNTTTDYIYSMAWLYPTDHAPIYELVEISLSLLK
jgi:hypothetical protein